LGEKEPGQLGRVIRGHLSHPKIRIGKKRFTRITFFRRQQKDFHFRKKEQFSVSPRR